MISPIFCNSLQRAFAVMVLGMFCMPGAMAHSESHTSTSSSDLLTQSYAAQAQHEFTTALDLLDQHLQHKPDDDAAWLQKMALHLIRGETDAARQACRQLRRSDAIVVVTCHARIAHAEQEPGRWTDKLERLLATPAASALTPELRAWSLSVVGDLAIQSGDIDRAERLYRESLAHNDNPQVRASLVDLLIDAERWADASTSIGQTRASLTLRVQRLIVCQAMGESVASESHRLAHRFEHWIEDGDFEHAREMARFYLDVVGDRDRALQLATINAELQHEPEDRLLLVRATQDQGRMF